MNFFTVLSYIYNDENWFNNNFLEKINRETFYSRLYYISITFFAILGSFTLWSYYALHYGKRARQLSKFPTFRKLPFVGNVWIIGRRFEGIRETSANAVVQLGRRFVFWIGHKPVIILADAKSVQKVLGSSDYLEKGSHYNSFKWIMGDGLVTSKADIWKHDRKMLNPYFKFSRFPNFVNVFNKYSQVLVSKLEASINESIDLHPFLSRAAMDFINESSLGATSSSFQDQLDSEFFKNIHTTVKIFRTTMFKPWLNLPLIWPVFGLGREQSNCLKFFRKFFSQVIQRHESELEAENAPFVDVLIANKTKDSVMAHVLTIFFAGFETTATAMNFTIYLLALHPKCQEKVVEEINKVFGDDPKRDVTVGDLSQLKYLEMCIKEAMRVYAPVTGVIRKPSKDIVLDDGLVIPEGCDVAFVLNELHNDPEVFPNPEEFQPERFHPDLCVKRSAYAWIPFSMGPRNCLGMRYGMLQILVTLTHVLRKFKVTTEMTRNDFKLIYGMVLEPSKPLKVRLTPRH